MTGTTKAMLACLVLASIVAMARAACSDIPAKFGFVCDATGFAPAQCTANGHCFCADQSGETRKEWDLWKLEGDAAAARAAAKDLCACASAGGSQSDCEAKSGFTITPLTFGKRASACSNIPAKFGFVCDDSGFAPAQCTADGHCFCADQSGETRKDWDLWKLEGDAAAARAAAKDLCACASAGGSQSDCEAKSGFTITPLKFGKRASACPSLTKYGYVCEADGKFAAAQCTDNGYCFCSDQTGETRRGWGVWRRVDLGDAAAARVAAKDLCDCANAGGSQADCEAKSGFTIKPLVG